jgi:hypothetical protein
MTTPNEYADARRRILRVILDADALKAALVGASPHLVDMVAEIIFKIYNDVRPQARGIARAVMEDPAADPQGQVVAHIILRFGNILDEVIGPPSAHGRERASDSIVGYWLQALDETAAIIAADADGAGVIFSPDSP